jgi:hypothetical protein
VAKTPNPSRSPSLFSTNVVRKRALLSSRTDYVLSSLHLVVKECAKFNCKRFGLLFCNEVARIRYNSVLCDVNRKGFYKRPLRFPE